MPFSIYDQLLLAVIVVNVVNSIQDLALMCGQDKLYFWVNIPSPLHTHTHTHTHTGTSQRRLDNSPHPTPAMFLTPTQESQPWDQTKSEAVLPPLNTHTHRHTIQTSIAPSELHDPPRPAPNILVPRQESQPWDETKSEAVFPSIMKLTRHYKH